MKRTILLVDDDTTLRGLLAEALEAQGFKIAQGSNGEEGVALALTEKPDLIISDIVMPEMDGWELCQTLRTLPSTKAIPFIFLTSLDQAPSKALGLRLGADDYLTKPFNFTTVLERVGRLIARLKDREMMVDGKEAEVGGDKIENMLVDTVELLRSTSRTGVISIHSGLGKGLIYMDSGVLKHAILGKHRGESALLAMLRLEKSRIAYKEGEYPDLPSNFSLSWDEFMASLSDKGVEATGDGPADGEAF